MHHWHLPGIFRTSFANGLTMVPWCFVTVKRYCSSVLWLKTTIRFMHSLVEMMKIVHSMHYWYMSLIAYTVIGGVEWSIDWCVATRIVLVRISSACWSVSQQYGCVVSTHACTIGISVSTQPPWMGVIVLGYTFLLIMLCVDIGCIASKCHKKWSSSKLMSFWVFKFRISTESADYGIKALPHAWSMWGKNLKEFDLNLWLQYRSIYEETLNAGL